MVRNPGAAYKAANFLAPAHLSALRCAKMVHRAAVEWMLLLTGAAALDCHADFWPEMHASPRRLEALILANGALVKLCFDADADGAVHRQHARAFLKAAGLVDVTVAGGLEDVLQRNDAV